MSTRESERCRASAVANGLSAPSPSAATVPSFAEKTITVLFGPGSIGASPRLMSRPASAVRFIPATNGLLRQASSITMRSE